MLNGLFWLSVVVQLICVVLADCCLSALQDAAGSVQKQAGKAADKVEVMPRLQLVLSATCCCLSYFMTAVAEGVLLTACVPVLQDALGSRYGQYACIV